MTPEQYARVREIFLAARDADPAQQADYLRAACGDDADILAEVRSLLASAARARTFLQTPALGEHFVMAGPESLARDSAPHAPSSTAGRRAIGHPEQIGQYRILDVLGEGGMGVVYRAQQENPRRVVALKVIKPGVESPETIRRFEHECQVLGWLQHPGIAQVYEAGTAEAGYGPQPFFAMELVQGQPLAQYAHAQRLGIRARLELLARICDAVHHAHQKGVIHRDLKPGNILVDEAGQPRILDFGVARATNADIRAATLQTSVGQLLGTVGYMSPEQIAGDPSALDTRSDVYTLGAILYELLTGRVPVDVSRRTLPEAARAIVEEEPEPLRLANRSLRGDIEAIVSKALEKDKRHRYQSASDLAADIRRYLSDQPVSARPVTAIYQLRKFARRNRALVVGLLTTGLALIVGIVGTSTGMVRAQRAEREARSAAAKAGAISYFIGEILGAVEPGREGRDVKVFEILDQAAAALDNEWSEHPEVEAALRLRLGTSYYRLGLYEPARTQLRRALELDQRIYGANSPEVAKTLSTLGTLMHVMGDYGEAEALHRAALDIRRRKAADADLANSINNLAALLHFQGRYDEAEQLYRETLALQRRVLGTEHAQIAATLNNLGAIYRQRGDLARAEQLHRQALPIYARTLGERHPDYVTCLGNLAVIMERQDRLDEAEELYGQVLELRRELLGPDHSQVGTTLNNLAKVCMRRGEYGRAEELYREALAVCQRAFGEEHPQTAAVYGNLAKSLLEQDRRAEAEAHGRQAVDLATRTLPAGHWSIGVLQAIHGTTLLRLGQYEQAETVLLQAHAALTAARGPQYERTREVAERLVELYEAWGRPAQAAEWRSPE